MLFPHVKANFRIKAGFHLQEIFRGTERKINFSFSFNGQFRRIIFAHSRTVKQYSIMARISTYSIMARIRTPHLLSAFDIRPSLFFLYKFYESKSFFFSIIHSKTVSKKNKFFRCSACTRHICILF